MLNVYSDFRGDLMGGAGRMPKTFYIKHDRNGYSISLETDKPKLKTLELLMYRIARYFIDKGENEKLRSIIIGILEAMLIE